MQLFEDFPKGLWVVKRIDRFHFSHNDSESALVDVEMQKLPFEDPRLVSGLNGIALAEILGRPPMTNLAGAQQHSRPFIKRPMLAGYLNALKSGDVICSGSKISSLPTCRVDLELTVSNSPNDIRYEDLRGVLAKPAGWSQALPYRALNPFEYLMAMDGDQPNDQLRTKRSRCLVIQHLGTEYILPKLVIFQAFYCINTNLINTFCNGPWTTSASRAISFRQYESGLATTVNETTGSWDIVVEQAMSLEAARSLALFWFDPYARACADALHTASRQDSGIHGNGWLASANIPYQLTDTPLKLKVEGFVLRSFNAWASPEVRKRFLITSILESSWPLQKQVIRASTHNSNEKGEVQASEIEDRAYRRGQEPVEGDVNATGTSKSDPQTMSASNKFDGHQFRYSDAPPLEPLHKQSSKRYISGLPPDADGVSALVSAGTPSHATDAPAKADITKASRDPLQQFYFLIQLMEDLVAKNVIESYTCCGPDDTDLLVDRNGLPCWSLLSRANRVRGTIPRKGWEIVKVHRFAVGSSKSFAMRYPRCVLILSIIISGTEIILFEIEPRPSETSAYRLVAFIREAPIESLAVGVALNAIREAEGRFGTADLSSIFSSLTTRIPSTRKHAYDSSTDPDTGEISVSGLHSGTLGHWLVSIVNDHHAR